jgi:hypothetical protein
LYRGFARAVPLPEAENNTYKQMIERELTNKQKARSVLSKPGSWVIAHKMGEIPQRNPGGEEPDEKGLRS